MYNRDLSLEAKIIYLKDILPSGKPIGITFSSERNQYYYDTVTGKVLVCQPMEIEIINNILSGEELFPKEGSDLHEYEKAIDNLIETVETEKIFSLAKFTSMAPFDNYEELVNNRLTQITLELTERCNLRCGYCIYNEACDSNRGFGEKDMPLETALNAIDYAVAHSKKSDELHIGYYGGEPLVNYKVMMESMKYALKLLKNSEKKLYFAFTTNAALLTEQMCEEISTIPNISITVSLDGPEEWHNMYRKNQSGQGSFRQALGGVKSLARTFGYDRAKDNILFSMVYAPPYSLERLEETQNFFDSLEWLPPECVKFITYPDEDSMDTISEYLKKSNMLRETEHGKSKLDFSLIEYGKKNWKRKGAFTNHIMNSIYLPIRKRTVFGKIMDSITLNGCCVPGQRKLYVTVDGKFKVCEKVGEIPELGCIEQGIDTENAKRIFLDEYREESIKKCCTCWYARLCSICYSGCYSNNKFDLSKKSKMCEEKKETCIRHLKDYFTTIEEDEHAFDYLDDIIVR